MSASTEMISSPSNGVCEGNINHLQRKERVSKMSRVYNFSAGPAVLPEEVLKQAAEEMLDYR